MVCGMWRVARAQEPLVVVVAGILAIIIFIITTNTNINIIMNIISLLYHVFHVLRTDRRAGVGLHSVVAEESCYSMLIRIWFDVVAIKVAKST